MVPAGINGFVMNSKVGRFREFVDLIDARRMPTLGEFLPQLQGQVREALLLQPVSRLFRFELLREAPATWMRDPAFLLEDFTPAEHGALCAALAELSESSQILGSLSLLTETGALALAKAGAHARCGPQAVLVEQLISACLAIEPQKFLPGGTINGAIFDSHAVFEARAAAWARTTHVVAEGAYIPLIKTWVDITNIVRERPLERWPAKEQLGSIMHIAARSWENEPSFASLLHDDVRLVRNAAAHVSLDVDLTNERVVLGSGGKAVSERELAEIARKLFSAILSMRAALQLVSDYRFARAAVDEGFAEAISAFVLRPLAEEVAS